MTITTAARPGRRTPGRTQGLGDCVRCFDPTPATTTERLTVGGDEYELELCERHADGFHRDIFAWTRLGTLVEDEDRAFFRRPRDTDAQRGQVVAAHIHIPTARETPAVPAPVAPAPVPAPPAQDYSGLSWAELMVRQVQLPGALPPGFASWTFSDHALERQEARGVSRAEALWCAAEPDIVHPSGRPNILIHKKGHVETVVNPTEKRIITVINRTITKEEEARAASR